MVVAVALQLVAAVLVVAGVWTVFGPGWAEIAGGAACFGIGWVFEQAQHRRSPVEAG